MKYYASENSLGRVNVEGSVEITVEQYKQALDAIAVGKVITVQGGFALIDPPKPVPDDATPEEKLAAFLAENPDVAEIVTLADQDRIAK